MRASQTLALEMIKKGANEISSADFNSEVNHARLAAIAVLKLVSEFGLSVDDVEDIIEELELVDSMDDGSTMADQPLEVIRKAWGG